jgi:UDP-N-acetylglucosamine 2-epimerase (non-hydrolysing)
MISIVLGTRPEIIKMTPIIKECQARDLDFQIVHTGQHYSYDMDKVFFSELRLPEADHHLDVGSGTHGEQTARILERTEAVFQNDRPDVVLVQGDTNTVMAASLAASKLHIPVGHVEAGLRSFDRRMPEEINRIMADHISSYLFAPTKQSAKHLHEEGINKGVHITGNTIVDAVMSIREMAEQRCALLGELGLERDGYILVTAHRAENVDDEKRLNNIVKGVGMVSKNLGLPVVFPMHPRTKKMMQKFGIELDGIKAIEPVGVLDFIHLEDHAALVMTDSGGVQEETCILGTPCLTMRNNTERPETVDVGSNVLVGNSPERMARMASIMVNSGRHWKNPFGDGDAAVKILDILQDGLSS